jgi:hypothetical protein
MNNALSIFEDKEAYNLTLESDEAKKVLKSCAG